MQVEVRESDIAGAGRGLFALQDFNPGDAVLRLARPYVAELTVERLRDTCAWCFLRGATDPYERASSAKQALPTGFVETKACTGCNKVRYCSKQCQTKAWKREHKHECKALQGDDRPDLPEGVRAVIKLLGRLKADPEGKDEALLEILRFRPYTDEAVMQQFIAQESEKMDDWQTLAYAAWKYAGEPVLGGTESLPIAKGFFFSIMFNAMSLGAPYNEDHFGIGFDPVLCSANHSCDPNVAMVFNQPETVLRATKPIKKSEEIFMKYVDVTNPWSLRQDELQRRYYFDCECSKCQAGPTTTAETFLKDAAKLDSRIAIVADGLISRHSESLRLHLQPGDDELAMRRLAAIQAEAFSVSGLTQQGSNTKQASEPEIKDALKLCINSGMWSYRRQPVPHLLDQIRKYYIETQQRYPAWRVALKMYFEGLPAGGKVPFVPERMIGLWSLAYVTSTLCYPDMTHIRQECMEAGLDLMVVFMGLVIEVMDNMPKSYGTGSPFGKVVETVYQQAMQQSSFSAQQLRDKAKETWPKLEIVAKSVDVLNL